MHRLAYFFLVASSHQLATVAWDDLKVVTVVRGSNQLHTRLVPIEKNCMLKRKGNSSLLWQPSDYPSCSSGFFIPLEHHFRGHMGLF